MARRPGQSGSSRPAQLSAGPPDPAHFGVSEHPFACVSIDALITCARARTRPPIRHQPTRLKITHGIAHLARKVAGNPAEGGRRQPYSLLLARAEEAAHELVLVVARRLDDGVDDRSSHHGQFVLRVGLGHPVRRGRDREGREGGRESPGAKPKRLVKFLVNLGWQHSTLVPGPCVS